MTEGGRRLYTDDDLSKLRLICLLKALGLNLDSIQGILSSEKPGKVLNLLLDEQAKQIEGEVAEKQKQLEAMKIVKESIRDRDAIPVNSINDIERIMKNKKGLKKVHGTLLSYGLAFAPFQIGSIILWIMKGIWIPFVIVYSLAILLGIPIIRFYHRNTAYICPECGATFRPTWKDFNFSKHTSKTRKLTCTKCGVKGWCVEVYADNSAESGGAM
ncbi:MAG: MerR family transcriptional regulator [Peptococcaceae bacterium]|nr:MerR family transcriptional regulator [Peptococcaceae bacterium]